MKQIKRADLHMHSTFSDGVEEPEELVVRAKNNGVELISLTDHDETGGLERMRAAAAQHGLQFVNGVEISADYGEVSIHVVGLDFDPEDEMLQALLSRIRDNRFERAVQMAEKLEKLGMKGVWEGVLKIVTNPRLIGRPHFAAWLAQNGYVEDYNAAFSKYLSRGKPGYVERAKTSIHEATSAILRAKGIPVLAHPGRYKLNEWEFDCMFEEFTGAGGHAIEVTTGSHAPGQNLLFCDFAQSRNLWASTGSDFHRPMNRCEPGLQGDLPGTVDPVWNHFRAA